MRTTLVTSTAIALVVYFAAVPSLHFGYALLVGVAVAALARRRLARAAGALYPALMLFVIVATGNHFLLDAAAGGLVMVAGWLVARRLATAPDAAVEPTLARTRGAAAAAAASPLQALRPARPQLPAHGRLPRVRRGCAPGEVCPATRAA